jgi:cytochrome P450
LDPFVLVGFSAGARTCLGKHLALLESKIAIIKIVKRYKNITISNPDFKMQFKFG